MPSFLSPVFLAGLLALAIPVLVHLRMRERKTSAPFPSLMFVRRIPHKSLRRRTLQNLVLFAARALSIALLSLAFARPFFPTRGGETVAGPRGRVVALDVSASMGYAGVFARALGEAERAVREVDAGDAVGVLLFSDRARGVVPPSTDHAKAITALSGLEPEARATRFAPALRLASDWLGALKVDRREVVLITDGQTSARQGLADISLPPGTSVSVRPVGASESGNAAVAGVTVEQIAEGGKTFGIVTARLIHQGRAVRSLKASLEVAGRTIEEKALSLPENGALAVTFARAPLPGGVSKGRIILTPDDLPIDDTFSFVLGASRDIKTLIVDPSPYVARALEIGQQPPFDIQRRSALSESDLPGRALVILGDLGPRGLSASAANALARFVTEGGGLIATTPLTGLRGDAGRLLPGSWGDSVSRLTDRGASLGFVDLDHPALVAFKQARGSDFSRARFLQYRLFRPSSGPDGERLKVLARFDDGREALVEASVGSGRVLAFTSTLDGLMSDLPVQPLFLPLIHELARHAAAHEETPLFHPVGAVVDPRGRERASTDDATTAVTSPDGRKRRLTSGQSGIELDTVGFYEAERASGARVLVAANLDSAESDLSALDPDELQAALRPAGRPAETATAITNAEAGARQTWWRSVLLALLLLMAAETILGNAKGLKTTS